jgi:hypothetical protein
VSAGIGKQFPRLQGQAWSAPAEAYAAALGEMLKLDLDLCVGPAAILPAEEGEVRIAAEYLVLVTSQYGPHKVSVYAFGGLEEDR